MIDVFRWKWNRGSKFFGVPFVIDTTQVSFLDISDNDKFLSPRDLLVRLACNLLRRHKTKKELEKHGKTVACLSRSDDPILFVFYSWVSLPNIAHQNPNFSVSPLKAYTQTSCRVQRYKNLKGLPAETRSSDCSTKLLWETKFRQRPNLGLNPNNFEDISIWDQNISDRTPDGTWPVAPMVTKGGKKMGVVSLQQQWPIIRHVWTQQQRWIILSSIT